MRSVSSTPVSQKMLCPACGSGDGRIFFRQYGTLAFCNVLYASPREARAAQRGDLHLAFCRSCGMVFNTAFQPALMQYSADYENSLQYSQHFAAYSAGLIDDLIARFDLRGKRIVEIGCGKGEFLASLCERGGNEGLGLDPSHEGPARQGDACFIKDYYSSQWSDLDADLIVCRQVLEHIAQPRQFLADIRRGIGRRRRTKLFIEVPNALYTLRDLGIWDLIYEHCGYYTPSSLARVLEDAGFSPRCVTEAYGGQYLTVEAAVEGETDRPARIRPSLIDAFDAEYRGRSSYWNRRLARLLDSGRHVAVWGAGSKGISFINTLDQGYRIEYVVDINPRKQGRHVGGSGQCVVSPVELPRRGGLTVIVTNPLYREEIIGHLNELSLDADVEVA